MDNPRQVTAIQAATVITSTIIGVGVLPLPLFAARGAGPGAPLLTAAAAVIAFFGLYFITKLGQRFPSQTIVQYSEALIGKWPARIGALLIILFFGELTALTSREFGEVVVTNVLKKTPLDVTVIVMLLLAALSTRTSITTFVYIHQFYVPLVLFPGLIIIALSLKNANVLYLQPIWGQDGHNMLHELATIASLFNGAFVLTMIIPFMRNPPRAGRAAVWGLCIAGGLYVLIVTATISVFGPEEAKKLLWPTLELAKVTSLPANILERLDAAFLGLWVIAVFTTLFSGYYFTIHSVSQLLRLKDHKLFSFMLLPYVFTVAMMPKNVPDMYYTISFVGKVGLLITIVYPMLLFVVALIRRKGGNAGERPASTYNGDGSERKPEAT
ncbi:GerAB/ArcD/ProY family transporter [Paenibacillus ginsengarvi]|uniref:Spore gernimation protein n=1 Tax=Paenibacillus ginsengarvi TaxID=400777 RepID=A0A3B0CJS8_9BACL|nr:endospore germination permease [Paenibacillus ginsengarvi]RKN85452.1 spore gernimation protein [Paenibacillus ginsengarvi]